MFRHNQHFQDVEEENDEGENDVYECEEEIDDTVKLSEIEPVLSKVESAMEKVSELLKCNNLKYDKCDFTAKNQNGLNMHIKAKHADKSS